MQLRTCIKPMEVGHGIVATGPIPRVTDFEPVPPHFLTDAPDGSGLVHDLLEDDQAVILDQGDNPPS
jgi:metal-dependent hydrolase (beta-lactamase superfamily II)